MTQTVPRWLYFYLWTAPHLLQVVLVIVMVRRNLQRRFPAFFLYTVCQVLLFAVLFAMDRIDAVTQVQYDWAGLAEEAISIVLRFAVVHEIFIDVFRSYPGLRSLGDVLFRWSTALLGIGAVIVVAYTSGTEMNRFTVAYVVVDRAVSIVQCGLLVLLILLARFFSLSWTNYAFGITLGFGLFASVELAVTALKAQYGVFAAFRWMDVVTMLTYHVCAAVWMVALALTERASQPITRIPSHELENWNDALQRLLQQ